MGGGLLQLKFLGKEAEFFIGNPQISFFRSVFKSYMPGAARLRGGVLALNSSPSKRRP